MWVVASLTQSRTCLPSRRSRLRRGPRGKAAAAASPERSLRSSPTPAAASPACQTSGRRAACNPRLLLGAGSGFPAGRDPPASFSSGIFSPHRPGFLSSHRASGCGSPGDCRKSWLSHRRQRREVIAQLGPRQRAWLPPRRRVRASGTMPRGYGHPHGHGREPAPATSSHEQDEAGPRNYFGRATSWL